MKKTIQDYTGKFELSRETYTTLNCWLNLTNDDIIGCLKSDLIFIADKYYRVPREQLINYYVDGKVGLINLTLVEYND